jgi:hypothetical protein
MKCLCFATLVVIVAAVAPSAFAEDRVHPLFRGVTEQQALSEFNDYEAKGKKCAQDRARNRTCAPISFWVEQPFDVPLSGPRGVELVGFRVGITTARALVRSAAYQFGLVARSRTPADRAEFLRRVIARSQDEPQEIAIVVKLVSRGNWSDSLPTLGFMLVNQDNAKLWSSSRPDFECSSRDIICQVGMAETGNTIVFPLFLSPGKVPFVKDTMRTLRLVVSLGDRNEQIDFDLNSML